MPLHFPFDWRNPDYTAVLQKRMTALQRIRANPDKLPLVKAHYKTHFVDFVNDWGMTSDPRNVNTPGAMVNMPFLMFDVQEEAAEYIMQCWTEGRRGMIEKSRDQGASWICVSFACWLSLFHVGATSGFGSRKEELVDKIGDPKSLFWKVRYFLENLPREFRGGWERKRHAPYMQASIPDTGSVIGGEAGNNIGRGGRWSIYFVDEAAHIEQPQMVDAALIANTTCRIDVSSVNGLGNPFAQLRHSGKVKVFTMHWRRDPRKDDAWYQQICADNDPVTVAQEYDINYSASVEGVLIPSAWVQAAVNAHTKLGIEVTGMRLGAMDVADEGRDKNAYAGRYGILVNHLDEWSGKESDIFSSVQRVFRICDEQQSETFIYDSDGLGAGVRGDARVINEQRTAAGQRELNVSPFRGSGAVHQPDQEMVKDRKNKDMFMNAKAQAWWALRVRFQKTWRAVQLHDEGKDWREGIGPDELISLDGSLAMMGKLTMELSQPTYSQSVTGKFVVDKQPDGTVSPNLADAVMIAFNPAGSVAAQWAALAG